eukprot:5056336-Alexandrium_andersonii.AAC.1
MPERPNVGIGECRRPSCGWASEASCFAQRLRRPDLHEGVSDKEGRSAHWRAPTVASSGLIWARLPNFGQRVRRASGCSSPSVVSLRAVHVSGRDEPARRLGCGG